MHRSSVEASLLLTVSNPMTSVAKMESTHQQFPVDRTTSQELASILKTGDLVLVKTDRSSDCTTTRKLIRFGQRIRRGCLSTSDHKLLDKHARVVHIGVVGLADPQTGKIRITEAVSHGAQDANFLSEDSRLSTGCGAVYKIYRAQRLPGDPEYQEQRVDRLRELTARHMRRISGCEDPNCNFDVMKHKPLFELRYSKLKAIRTVFLRCWGWRATPKRVLSELLHDYARFTPRQELPWNEGKVRSQVCSSLAVLRAQLAEFEVVVDELQTLPELFDDEATHQRFVDDLGKLRHPDFSGKCAFVRFLNRFSNDWADLIYERMVYLPMNALYASPMELAEHLETSTLFKKVLTLIPNDDDSSCQELVSLE